MAETLAAQWVLLVPQGQAWRTVDIGERVILGSDASCDVRLVGSGIAQRHCRVHVHGGIPGCVDLGHGQATTLRGQRVTARSVPLSSGDVLRLGRIPVILARRSQRRGADWLEMGELGSAHPSMCKAMIELALASATAWPLWLQGESGVGKELAARLVHDRSPRSAQPWVAVNCGALHGDTLLAELFGAARGAYTGCVEARRGAFERADGGTLFLDEVAELTAAAQAALLRVLESGEVQVLGGPLRQVDVRIVCASHRDLHAEVQAGRFRLDLLHRLSVLEVHLPPLRERGADVAILLDLFLEELPVPVGAEAVLAAHPWSGNVRELRNVARRLQAGAMWGDPSLGELRVALGNASPGTPSSRPWPGAGLAVSSEERRRVVASLLSQEPNTAQALRKSGLPRGTFFRYLKELRADSSLVPAF